MFEVEHEIPKNTEKSINGAFIILWSLIAVMLLFVWFMETYTQRHIKTKASYHGRHVELVKNH